MNSNRQLHKIEIATKKNVLHNSDLYNLPLLIDGSNLMTMVWC